MKTTPRVLALVALLALAACSPPEQLPHPAAQGWYEFEGSWVSSGTRRILPLGADRRAAIVDLRGTLLLAGPSRPGVGFSGEVVALTDTASGMIGHAAWTDEHGDQVFSDLRGEGTAKGNRITGSFTGGTGRYAGATGAYEFSWQYVIESEDGTVQGRAIGLKGRVRFDGKAGAPAQGGGK